MLRKIIKKSYLLISLMVILALVIWAIFSSITKQPEENKVYVVKENKANDNSFTRKISQLNLETTTYHDLIGLFGEPQEYFWGDNTYAKENLPDYFYMKYSDYFDVFIVQGKIVEMGIFNPSYAFMDIIKVGSGVGELKKAGLPLSIEKYTEGELKDGILYTDYNSLPKQYWYTMQDKRIKLLFNNNKIIAIYINRKDKDSLFENYKSHDDLGNKPNKVVDKTNYPFIFDKDVIGRWKSVDIVRAINDFHPNNSLKGIPYLDEIVFQKNSRCKFAFLRAYQNWTKGLVLDFNSRTASKYKIKNINGSKYMFLQWKGSDYTLKGMKPFYYVLKKAE